MNKEPKNILFVVDNLLPGGTTKHILNLHSELSKRNKNIFIAAFNSNYILIDKNKLIQIPLFNSNGKKFLLGFFWSIIILVKFIKNQKIEIIHSHKRYSDLLSRIVSRITFIPHLSTCHGIFNKQSFLSPFGDFTIATGSSSSKILQNVFHKKRDKIEIIKNILFDDENIVISKRKLKLTSSNNFCWIGYSSPDKNLELLFQSLNYLVENLRIRNFTFYLKVLNTEIEFVQKQIAKLKLIKYINLVNDDTSSLELFKSVSFGILTSKSEGGSPPYVILEAAKFKKPYISTNINDIPEFIVHNKNGLLTSLNHIELAENIKLLLDNNNLSIKLGIEAFKTFTKHQKNNLMIEETLKVYNRIINAK